MALRDYYLKEYPGNEWRLYRERTIGDVKYTHYRNGHSRDLVNDHWVSFLNKEEGTSVLIVQRYKEGMQESG